MPKRESRRVSGGRDDREATQCPRCCPHQPRKGGREDVEEEEGHTQSRGWKLSQEREASLGRAVCACSSADAVRSAKVSSGVSQGPAQHRDSADTLPTQSRGGFAAAGRDCTGLFLQICWLHSPKTQAS